MTKYDPAEFFSAERRRPTMGNDDLIRRGDALSEQNKSMNLNEMRERLNRIPAVDAVEVRHGRWKRVDYEMVGHDYVCSECGEKNDRASRWCPDCGARMDGEEEHNASD